MTGPTQPFRCPDGGLIDRARPLSFTFDGSRYQGYVGDTLASALLANGVRLVGRSFKYHRPRGIYSAGPEEPNALVRLRAGACAEPNTRATMIELFDGLVAESQNRWPSLRFDAWALNGLLAPLFPAGFYYKTFKWPAAWWEPLYERFIRRAAGMGTAAREPDPDRYEKRYAHGDVLVVGGGPAGLMAAMAAAHSGARVILVDETAGFGGALKRERRTLDGRPVLDWVKATVAALEAMPEVILLPRTTAFGYYDHNLVALVERVADHVPAPPPHTPRQRLWLVRAKQVVFATGAIERPLVFADNDRPGVMLASAARAYVNQYAVRPGRRAVVFTNNDDAYRTALDLHDAGVEVAAVVDARPAGDAALVDRARDARIEILAGHGVTGARGRAVVSGVEVAPAGKAGLGARRRIDCDLIAVSGGWSPTVHLHSQSGGKPMWDNGILAFVPGAARQATRAAGAARGLFRLADCLADGAKAGAEAARAAGFDSGAALALPACADEAAYHVAPLWSAAAPRRGKSFVDIQDDVTADDVALAAREGYVSVEHLKRYTTLGMGTDQGKTSNVNGLAIMAALRGAPIPAVGTTTFRPPYTPVTLGAMAGTETGAHFAPVRRTPLHAWHERAGAVFVDAGLWRRPRYYPRAGEDMAAAVAREVKSVREGVGLVDVSTLGKIEVQGPDAAELLDRVYANRFVTLPVGRARYGLMLREDGIVFDDGTTARIGATRYLMTTTTINAAKVLAHLEYHLQVVWPELRVQVASVTDAWVGIALAGPKARAVLETALTGIDVSAAAFPLMAVGQGRIAGVPVWVSRISYSGDLAYEILAPADHGETVWQALLAAGAPSGIVPYGTEAMNVMRVEKGHVAGPEIDGRTTADDLGLARLVKNGRDFIGRRLAERLAFQAPERPRLVGLTPADGVTRLAAGAHIVADANAPPLVPTLGHVTSAVLSPTLGRPIALGLVAAGLARKGETLFAVDPLRGRVTAVVVSEPHFFDPDGKRLHA